MTPHELNIIADFYGNKIKAEQEERLSLAYMTAYWQRVETLQPLSEILYRSEEKQEMSDMEMLIKVQQLNALFGGSVK